MLKIWAYILSFMVFTQALGFNPKTLINLDDIWSHYKMHQEDYGDDFLTFMDLHYGNGKAEHQDDHKGHENLPIADFNHLQIQVVFLFLEDFDFQPIGIFSDKSLNVIYKDNYFSTITSEVFQPPKQIV